MELRRFRRTAAMGTLVVLCGALPAAAQAPARLVKDIPTRPRVETFGGAAPFGSEIVFGAYELWKTDGTEAGTVMIKDINPLERSYPHKFQVVGGTVWFVADDGVHGNELWRTNGTEAGTELFADILPGPDGSEPELKAAGSLLFFSADDGTGPKLWRTDGTAPGTFVVTPPTVTEIRQFSLAAAGNLVYFSGRDATRRQPWRSDGTSEGTFRLAEIDPGGGDAYNLVFSGRDDGSAFFLAREFASGTRLWKTDGTVGGTAYVAGPEISPGFFVDPIQLKTTTDGRAYFVANSFNPDYTVNGSNLWVSDGTAAGTSLVKGHTQSISQGLFDSLITLLGMSRGLLYYSSWDENFHSSYRSDGTPAGTFNVPIGLPPYVVTLNGTTVAPAGVYSPSIYATDGTVAGTRRLMTASHGLGGVVADDYMVTGLWRFDLTHSAETDLQPVDVESGADGVYAADFFPRGKTIEVGGALLYASSSGALWRSDGSDAGTFPLADLSTHLATDEAPLCIERVGTLGLFWGSDGELWRTNGTVPGTFRVKDIVPGPSGGMLSCLTEVDGPGYFFAYDGTDVGLWRTDGTSAGTQLVRALPGTENYFYHPLPAAAGPTAFFVGKTPYEGLWASDGTTAGTEQLSSAVPTVVDTYAPAYSVALDNPLFFFAPNIDGACWLWKSDGTAPGTVPFASTDYTVCDFFQLARANGKVFFTSFHESPDRLELWTTDGATTTFLADMGLLTFPDRMIGFDGGVFFRHDDGANGREPWVSDGTAAGTHIIRDLLPGSESSDPFTLGAINGLVFFRADDGIHGRELWRTDGTDAGTWLVADLMDGLEESLPASVALGSTLFFSAESRAHRGRQLWKVPNLVTCGNGVIDPGEQCDDANGDNSDTCTVACLLNVCGDHLLRAGVEDCDDGNTADGDCCSSSCTFEPPNAPCTSDGDPCSADECDGAGTCRHVTPIGAGTECRPAAGPCDVAEFCDGTHPFCPIDRFDMTASVCRPATTGCAEERCTGTAAQCPVNSIILGCQPPSTTTTTLPQYHCAGAPEAGCGRPVEAGKASLILKNKSDDLDQLIWKWNKGAATAAADFGDPVTTDHYAFCLYDESSVPTLLYEMKFRSPSRFYWKGLGNPPLSKGVKYSSSGIPDGIIKMSLKPGAAGKAKILVHGKGSLLPFVPGPAVVPVPLRVQLQAENGHCWEARYTGPSVNDGELFRAKSE